MTTLDPARVSLAARIVPPSAIGGRRSTLLVWRNLLAAKQWWIVLVSGFFEPLLYLLGVGFGVGELVGRVDLGDGTTVRYTQFVAPALLAASAMNGAVYESTMNIFFKLRHQKTYDAVLATPLKPGDVALGEIAYALMRGTVYAIAFVLVMLALGLIASWWAVLAVPAAVLVGFAFAAVGMAATTFLRTWADLDLIQTATLPLFLFSATFAPLAVYPDAIRWVVPLTPLYHGVALLRDLCLGTVGAVELVHVGYLLAMGVAGLIVAGRRLEGLLLT